MQQGDYTSSYFHYPQTTPTPNPTPNPIDPPHHPSYASAPPGYSPSDYPVYSPNYPSYSHNPDPTAPSYGPTAPQPQQPQQPLLPSYESHAQPYYPPFDHHHTPLNYPPNSAAYNPGGTTAPAPYDSFYDISAKYDQNASYLDNYRSDLGSDVYGKRQESRHDEGYGDGIYAYEGGKVEPYGARGTASKSSTWTMFDDYGRSISVPEKNSSSGGSSLSSSKIVRAVPKMETQQDVKSGVQKFRVKLLPESGGQNTMDVLCQIGLDGIRMLDPNSSRTLRIYPLENITRCEVTDSSTLALWSKSSVDIEPRRIRLQSNSYTTNTLLDIVTAATVQLKEMGGRSKPSDFSKATEQPTEKKKGLTDWMNIMRPGNEEKDHWVPDEAVSKCTSCGTDFGAFVRRHHCRNCGDIFCDKCTHGRIALTAEENAQPVRVCDRCLAEVTQRLTNAKEATSKPVGLQSHEDLARKLQEEMEKNRKGSSESKSDGSGQRMREVACPTCTVHLQVQVPSSGSETIECGVCQHPFLVSAH